MKADDLAILEVAPLATGSGQIPCFLGPSFGEVAKTGQLPTEFNPVFHPSRLKHVKFAVGPGRRCEKRWPGSS